MSNFWIHTEDSRYIVRNIKAFKKTAFQTSRIGIKSTMYKLKKDANKFVGEGGRKWWGGRSDTDWVGNAKRPWESISLNWKMTEPWIDGNTISATLYNISPHAHFVEAGTNTPITPRNKMYMKFYGGISREVLDKSMGKTKDLGIVYTSMVKGQQGKHYLQYARDVNINYLPNIFKQIFLSAHRDW